MITLSNFVKDKNGFTLLLTMGKDDTVDMLPTAQKPFSPEFYPVSVDYGVPAPGSVAINYFTQENFMFVNGVWGKDSIPSVLKQIEIDENGVYVPEEGVDGYDKVTVDVPQLDTTDATAIASDLLSPKTAYVNGVKITGTLETESGTGTPKAGAQIINPTAGKLFDKFTIAATPLDAATTVTAGTANKTVNPTSGNIGIASIIVAPTPSSAKTVTPTKSVQNVTPESGQLLSGVTVNAIPAQYIVPTGSQTITTNGTVDVTALASVSVNVPSTDIYKHEIYMKLAASDVEDVVTSNYADYNTCEIRYDVCNETSRTYSASDLQEIMDYVFPYGNYGLASIKFVNNQSAAVSYFSQFKVDDVQTGEFSLSNWEEAGKIMIKDKMTNVTITDTVTKIS